MIEKLSLYRSFATVVRCGSISAAAKELFVTQPAVSTDIISLEGELGVRLFFRTNTGMKLTEEGRILYNHVSGAFSFLESGEEAMRGLAELKSGHLRIGASDMTLKFYLLDYIEKFCRDYPGIRLSVTNNPTPQTIEALKSGNIDFGVISEYGDGSLSRVDGIKLIPVREIRDVFVCSPDNPLASAESVTPAMLCEYPIVMLERTTGTRLYLKTQKGYEGLEADIELSTSDLLVDFATRGIGVAAVARDFAEEAIREGRLCEIKLAFPIKPRHFLLAYLEKIPRTAAAEKLVEILLDAAEVSTDTSDAEDCDE